ncbi:MAG: peptide deformylase [Chitinophaga sp.]|nr:peptide deformylase [Chitinophaga sp.]
MVGGNLIMFTTDNIHQENILRKPIRRNLSLEELLEKHEMFIAVGKLLETMTDRFDGLGMAAPQLGHLMPVVYVKGIGIMIDPKILKASGDIEITEGCLSIVKKSFKVNRFFNVRVLYFDEELVGRTIDLSIDTDGFIAVCVQHEIDHLDGVLIDRK